MVNFTNDDGLVRRYGPATTETIARRSAASVRQTIVIPFTYDNLPSYDADASGGETPDSFSGRNSFVPAGSMITDAYLVATTAWTGTATIDIGFESQAGVAQDVDALYDGLDVDHADTGLATVGAAPQCNGVGAVGTSGTYDPDWSAAFATADMYIRVINADAGTLTAGAATLVVEFINPNV